MTFRLSTITRLVCLAAAAALLPAAGQYPVALLALSPIVATSVDAVAVDPAADQPPVAVDRAEVAPPARPSQLSTLVARTIDAAPTAYGERECLARAVYFEARGEPLEGQLAVAQVILNRVASGRFADSVCGVINQHGQFSFSKSRAPVDSQEWQTAKAIAAIAATASWDVVAPQATAFHATRINTNWSNLHKVSTIGNHVFYR